MRHPGGRGEGGRGPACCYPGLFALGYIMSLLRSLNSQLSFSKLFQTSTMLVFTASCNGAAGPKLGVSLICKRQSQ
jgi:hypothetical protein